LAKASNTEDTGCTGKVKVLTLAAECAARMGHPRSSLVLGALVLQQGEQGGRCDDSGGFVALQDEKWLIAGYEKVSLSGFGEREQVIVVGVGRHSDLRQVLHYDGCFPESIDQSPSEGWGEPITNSGVARHARDFLQLFAGSEEVELAVEPECKDLCRRRIRRHQGTKEDIGVEYQPHRSFSGTALTLPSLLLADACDGFVNKVLEFVGGHVDEGCAHLADGLIQ